MKILRLGKNGMVRSQKGTWFIGSHFIRFYVHLSLNGWQIIGETNADDLVVGIFDTEEEAQAELDSLFGEDEKGEKCT